MVVSSKTDENNGFQEFQQQRMKHETKWESFQKLIYNPENKSVFGRTGKSWGQLLLFYSIFYAVLAALFAICMQGLLASISDTEPTWTLDRSIIGSNPGLGFRPVSERTVEGSLIWYNITTRGETDRWVRLIDEFLKPYSANQTGENYVNCDYDRPPAEGEVCVTDISQLGSCNKENDYGYRSSSPCIFLKLNRIFGWSPEYYTEALPEMPEDLKLHISKNVDKNETNQVWVSCQGVDVIDRERIGGFNYYPQGFAGYYYPYRNFKNYLSPVVAVEILNLTPNSIVSIECRAWAKNIKYKGGSLDRAGSVQFELQVDTATGKNS